MQATKAQHRAWTACRENDWDVTKTAQQLEINRGALQKTLFNAHINGLPFPVLSLGKSTGKKHLYIPDCQVTPSTPTDHLRWIGKYIVEKKPDEIICAGDFADMESLCSYDKGKIQFEGRRYKADCNASVKGMEKLLDPLREHNIARAMRGLEQYKPQKHLTLGNHENRIARAVESRPEMDGLLSVEQLGYDNWNVIPFLEVKEIDGVSYCHYFYNPLSGRAKGGLSMEYRLKDLGFSFVQGHQQIYMVGTRSLNNGERLRGLVCGQRLRSTLVGLCLFFGVLSVSYSDAVYDGPTLPAGW